jgi:hypothetical protein
VCSCTCLPTSIGDKPSGINLLHGHWSYYVASICGWGCWNGSSRSGRRRRVVTTSKSGPSTAVKATRAGCSSLRNLWASSGRSAHGGHRWPHTVAPPAKPRGCRGSPARREPTAHGPGASGPWHQAAAASGCPRPGDPARWHRIEIAWVLTVWDDTFSRSPISRNVWCVASSGSRRSSAAVIAYAGGLVTDRYPPRCHQRVGPRSLYSS